MAGADSVSEDAASDVVILDAEYPVSYGCESCY